MSGDGELVQQDDEFAPRHSGRPWLGYAIAAAIIGLMIVPALAAASLIWALSDVHLPSIAEVTSRRVIALQTADGLDLPGRGGLRLPPIAVKDMPANVVDAVLSIEDRRFYQHGAVDMPSMLRAFKQNLEAHRVVAGGSTITQQLVKILLLHPQRTYKRKIQEATIAIWLEHNLSKDDILTSYLNNVYLGSGATGFPAAAKVYFGKNINELSLAEAAMLAGMINAPSQDDPFHDLAAARSRAATVLDAMASNRKVSPEAALVAKLHPAAPTGNASAPPSSSWFADWVYDKAAKATPALAGTVHVRTTLDPHLQEQASDIVKSALAAYGDQKHATEAALVAMRPDGAVVAMVGGRSYADSQFNRAVQAERQPGSAFKLFDYYAALRQGFSLDDEVLDEPVDIKGWEPDNFGSHYHGEVTLADAFAHSLNAATVRLSQQVGINQIIAAARDLGLRAPLGSNPSLALGTSEVTLLDLTSAYAAVRAGTAPIEPWGIATVSTPDDQHDVPVGRPDQPQHSLGDYQGKLIRLLQGVVDHGTGRAAALSGFSAGKTGTSQDYRDAWFVGFDDSLVAGVWVGNDDHSPMKGVVGGSIPAMIWKQFMEKAEGSAVVTAQQPPTVQQPTAQQPTPQQPAPTARQQFPPPQQQLPTAQQQPPESNGPPEQSTAQSSIRTEGSQCNVSICQQYYQSFRTSDCTYQPYSGGPRQYCER